MYLFLPGAQALACLPAVHFLFSLGAPFLGQPFTSVTEDGGVVERTGNQLAGYRAKAGWP